MTSGQNIWNLTTNNRHRTHFLYFYVEIILGQAQTAVLSVLNEYATLPLSCIYEPSSADVIILQS